MARVICDMSTSLDGYVTGPNDNRENPFGDGAQMLHDWIFDAATDEDRAILQDMLDGVGAIVMGRTSFDKNEGDGPRVVGDASRGMSHQRVKKPNASSSRRSSIARLSVARGGPGPPVSSPLV
jgi:hypothetical protein